MEKNSEKIKKINIGLDIGISSVGWSIIDENNEIIDLGVRLFDDVAKPKDGTLLNEERREARGLRRNYRRIRQRKNRFKKFIQNNSEIIEKGWKITDKEYEKLINIEIDKFGLKTPIDLKVKALNEKITKEQLVYILFHYIDHRGYTYLDEKELTDEILNAIDSKILPSINIAEFNEENGYYKGSKETSLYSIDKYKDEIREILKIQGIDDQKFIDTFVDKIFGYWRDFSQGPGSSKSPTIYGMWYLKDGQIVKKEGDNLWDTTIGNCTYYPNEKRGAKFSPIAELFNLISDINNIHFFQSSNPEFKLDKEIKEKIYEKYTNNLLEGSYNLTKQKLIKLGKSMNWFNKKFGVDEVDISKVDGYRLDSSKTTITELKNYKLIVSWLVENKIISKEKINIFNLELLEKANELFHELAKIKDARKRLENLNTLYPDSSKESNIKLVRNLEKLSSTHSLSYFAMKKYIKFSLDNLEINCNQMQFFNMNAENNSSNNDDFKNDYIPKNLYAKSIISPTAKRAFIQTINVLNKILKKYVIKSGYKLNKIIVELARDKNTAEERKKIKKIQDLNRSILQKVCEENNSPIPFNELKSIQKIRLRLFHEQKGIDLYDDQQINFIDALYGTNLEIDHIIPLSISNDDSQNNKVLTKKNNNFEKGQRTPYFWLSQKPKRYEKFKDLVKKVIENDKKIENLTYELDPSKELYGFVGRNLVDTRYASRETLNLLQSFFNAKEDKYGHVIIKVIRGKMTNFARHYLLTNNKGMTLVPKDRNIYSHHAIDASIVSWLGANPSIEKTLNQYELLKKSLEEKNTIDIDKNIINKETGEVLGKFTIEKNEDVVNFANEISKYNSTYNENNCEIKFGEKADLIKYSRMLITKKNIKLSNETIYSFEWDKDKKSGRIIRRINLLDHKNISLLKSLFKDGSIAPKKLEKLYCYNVDKKLYDDLKEIYNSYYVNEKINPFLNYMFDLKGIDLLKLIEEKKKIKNDIQAIKWVDVKGKKVKRLKYLGDKKDTSNILILKNHNNNAIMESLNSLELRIYKNDKGKYVLVPINQKVLKYDHNSNMLVVDKTNLDALLDELNISNKKFWKIKNGTVFLKVNNTNSNINDLYYANAGGVIKTNLIQLKCLYTVNEYSSNKDRCEKDPDDNNEANNGRIRIPLQELIDDYLIVDIDELGNIYRKRKIVIE